MLQDYNVRIRTPAGTLVYDGIRPHSVEVEHRLNWFSSHTVTLYGNDEAALFLAQPETLDYFIEVWRRVDGIWYEEYVGHHRTPHGGYSEEDRHFFLSYGRGGLWAVQRREILYPANSRFTLKSGPADQVISEFVAENCLPTAKSPPRFSPVVQPAGYLTVAPAAGNGPQWAGAKAHENVLDAINDISAASGVDFGVRRGTGFANFQFFCGWPQLGQDLYDTVKFSPELGNMISPDYVRSRTEEVNTIVALGPGQGRRRHVIVRRSGAASDSLYNEIEGTINASSESTLRALEGVADTALKDREAKESFTFQVRQTDDTRYGIDYKVGDVVQAAFGTIRRRKKVTSARLVARAATEGEPTRETIEMEFGDPPSPS